MDTKKLRQKILDLAIRGKLVPQDPNDEPASVLLERIRIEKERLIKEGKIKRNKKTVTDDEIEAPFEIPESWIACKLEDIAYIGTGATPDTRNSDYYNGIIPWVSSSCTKYDYIDTPTSYITQKAIDETNCRIYPKGTLIMAMYGEGKTRGQISELKIDAATNQACAAIVPYNLVTAQYIKLYLKRSYLHIREQAEGGTQPNLNLSKIAKYDIPLPPLYEQQRIANEVKRWFALIDELESNEGDLLKAIAQAKSKILDLAIHGKLVPQDPDDEPAIDLLKRINPKFESCDEESYGNVITNWTHAKVDDIGELLSGRDLSNDVCNNESKGIPYLIGASNIVGNSFSIIRWTEHPQVISTLGDMLISCKGTIGTIVMNSIGNMHIARQFMAIRPNDSCISTNYLHLCLLAIIKEIKKDARGVIPGISREDLLEKIIPLPPYREQLRIVAKLEELFTVLDSIKETLE